MVTALGGVVVAAYLLREQEREEREEREKREKEKKKQNLKANLLLKGGAIEMEIGQEEKVIIVLIYNQGENWVSYIDGKAIAKTQTFPKCIQETIEQYDTRGIQLIPYSINGSSINSYYLMIKVPDAEKLNRKHLLDKTQEEIQEKLTQEIQTAW